MQMYTRAFFAGCGVIQKLSKNLLRRRSQFMSQPTDKVRAAAIHEAGHIVAAHFAGFSVEYARINGNGDGQTQVNYGELGKVAAPLLSTDRCPEFQGMFLDMLNRAPLYEFGKKLCFILLAGGAAEVVCTIDSGYVGEIEVEVSGPDLTKAEAIASYLHIDLQEQMTTVSACMKDPRFTTAISELTDAMIVSGNAMLNRNDITAALTRSGFLDFLEQP
jgi:hypothetical protein